MSSGKIVRIGYLSVYNGSNHSKKNLFKLQQQSKLFMDIFLKETYYFDYSHPSIQALVADLKSFPVKEQIAQLFRKTRDGWRYNPYTIYLNAASFKSSFIASKQEGHCIDKAVILISALRALGIPARLRLAKVANHIAVERLTEKLGSHYIAPHGIAELYVDGRWVKASNAFNQSLCDKFNVDALEFDGSTDAILQPFNREQEVFMEYVEDYGHFEDVPFEFILQTFKEQYPALFERYNGALKIDI